ncbi:type VI secretion system contractile sheath small subunit [Pseudomonas aeruginosa]
MQITYDVEIGNAIEKKESPLVVGILADLSGKPDTLAGEAGRTAFRRHRPRQLQRDPLPISPLPTLQVDNTISGDDSKLNVELRFNHIEDFDPVNLVEAGGPVASPVRSAPAPARPADQARRQRRPRPVAAGRGGQHRRPAGIKSGLPGSRSGPGRRQRTPGRPAGLTLFPEKPPCPSHPPPNNPARVRPRPCPCSSDHRQGPHGPRRQPAGLCPR